MVCNKIYQSIFMITQCNFCGWEYERVNLFKTYSSSSIDGLINCSISTQDFMPNFSYIHCTLFWCVGTSSTIIFSIWLFDFVIKVYFFFLFLLSLIISAAIDCNVLSRKRFNMFIPPNTFYILFQFSSSCWLISRRCNSVCHSSKVNSHFFSLANLSASDSNLSISFYDLLFEHHLWYAKY